MTSAGTAYTIAGIRSREAERPVGERLFDDPFVRHFGTGGAEVEPATQRMLALPFIDAVAPGQGAEEGRPRSTGCWNAAGLRAARELGI